MSAWDLRTPRRRFAIVRRVPRPVRPLGNKLQEIARRSPKDVHAFEALANLVLDRLDERDFARQRKA